MVVDILVGDCRALLKTLPAKSFQCCVTSPPYFGLRDYRHADQIGQEQTPEAFVSELVSVFREVWRVLKDDGTLWLNLGDSYGGSGGGPQGATGEMSGRKAATNNARTRSTRGTTRAKDMLMIPARIALALQADGWYIRSDIIWAKPNSMPESVADRPSSAHEHLFLLTKKRAYYYDADAIREPAAASTLAEINEGYRGHDTKGFLAAGVQSGGDVKRRVIEGHRKRIDKQRGHGRTHAGFSARWDAMTKKEQQMVGANARNVWNISPQPFPGAHFATMPPKLVDRCIKAGTKESDLVLDPFGGAGTVGYVADRLRRNATLIELNPEYAAMSRQRIDLPDGVKTVEMPPGIGFWPELGKVP